MRSPHERVAVTIGELMDLTALSDQADRGKLVDAILERTAETPGVHRRVALAAVEAERAQRAGAAKHPSAARDITNTLQLGIDIEREAMAAIGDLHGALTERQLDWIGHWLAGEGFARKDS